jgi:hypothetical protein
MVLQNDTDQVRNSVRVPQPNLCYLRILKSQPSGRMQGQAQDQRVPGEEERRLAVIEKQRLQRGLPFFQILQFSI